MSGETDEAKTLEDQIDDMITDLPVEEENEVVEEVEEVVEDEPTETEEVEPVEDTTEVTEESGDDEVSEEVSEEGEEEGEAEDGGEETGDVEETVDEIAEFRDRMNKMAQASLEQGIQLPAELLGVEEGEAAPVAPAAEPAPVVQPVQTPETYNDFKVLMDGVEFDSFMDNEETFTSGMRDILSRHEQILSQRFMNAIPNIVQNQVKQVAALQRAADKFYDVNTDLKEVRPTVGAVSSQVATKHPDWSINKVMEESAKVTRKLLRLPSPIKKKKGTVVRPSFAKQGGSKQRAGVKPKMSTLQKEIDELL